MSGLRPSHSLKFFSLLTIAGTLWIATPLAAVSWEEANDLYDRRGEAYKEGATLAEKAANIKAAMDMYKELMETETDPFQRIYGGGAIAGTYYYISEILMPKNRTTRYLGKTRPEWATECFEYMEIIGPERMPPNQPYFLGKLACLTIRMEQAGLVEQLASFRYFQEGSRDDLFYRALELGYEFFGGGILRVAARVRSNPAAVAIGLGDFDLALQYARMAVELEETSEFDRFDNNGGDYCDNHLTLAKVFIAMDKPDQARDVMLGTLDRFWVEGNAEDFVILQEPKGLEFDTVVCIEALFEIAEDNGFDL